MLHGKGYKIAPYEVASRDSPLYRSRSVTIAAGFKCIDGMVLAADTQETVGDYKKRNCAKIEVKPFLNPMPPPKEPRRKSDPRPSEPPPPQPELIAGFAGAGHTAFVEKLIEKAWESISVADSFEARCEALEKSVIDLYERLWPIYPEHMKPDAELLVGLWSPSEFELFKVDGPIVSRVKSHAFIGCGFAEANSFADRLDLSNLTTKKASCVALHILRGVKEQVPGCGGDTHLLLMDGKGHAHFENAWKIKWSEEKLRRLEEAVGPLILAIASGDADTDEFRESLGEFGLKLGMIKEELERVERAIDQAADYRPGK